MFDLVTDRVLPVVLLIDDDLVSREVAATLLTLEGLTVHTAESGEDALGMLAADTVRPNVILTDAQMPGLSGIALIARLRAACRRAALYIISGSPPADDIVRVADGLLLKPFDARALRKLLEGKSEERVLTFLSPDDAVLSKDVLTQLRQMMPEKAVRDILAAVVADLVKRIELLGTAIAQHDLAEVRRIGHAIKGGCGMAGAVQAARLGALLEAESTGEDRNYSDNSTALLSDLRSAVHNLQRILDDELPA